MAARCLDAFGWRAEFGIWLPTPKPSYPLRVQRSLGSLTVEWKCFTLDLRRFGCIDCDPENPDYQDDEFRCVRCRPAFEAWAREMGGRDGCGDLACPYVVTHQHEADGSVPQWLVDQTFDDLRRKVQP